MYFADLPEIVEAAVRAANRNGVPYYILRNPSRKGDQYTALSSVAFGLPDGFFIQDIVRPSEERVEIEPPEKTSTNGF